MDDCILMISAYTIIGLPINEEEQRRLQVAEALWRYQEAASDDDNESFYSRVKEAIRGRFDRVANELATVLQHNVE